MEVVRAGEIHPLQNEYILETIFKNLSVSDLKAVRQVCRLWRQHSSKALRASAVVHISSDKSTPKRPSQFLELVQSNGSIFLETPFVSVLSISHGIAPIQEFWEIVGSKLKVLLLVRLEFQSVESFRRAIFLFCPNLEELYICNLKVNGVHTQEPTEWVPPQFPVNENLKLLSISNMSGECGLVWMDIWSHFTSVEHFDGDSINDCSAALFQSLETARNQNDSDWKIQEFTLKVENDILVIPASCVQLFTEGNIALTSLKIGGIHGDRMEDVSAVQSIISANATSLEDLSINGHSIPDAAIFPLVNYQVLKKVVVLTLNGFIMSSMGFSSCVPNLKMLGLHANWQINDSIRNDGAVISKCTKLVFSIPEDYTNPGQLRSLHRVLPNLHNIWIAGLYSNDFSLVCELWPKVEVLEIGKMLGKVDAGLSGFDTKDVKKINRRRDNGSWRPITVRRANLSSVSNLHSLCLGSKPGHCGISYGILEHPKLQDLKITASGRLGKQLKAALSRFPWMQGESLFSS